jgi:hypothetical protein
MSGRRIVINVPEEVLAAERMDEASFAHELSGWPRSSCTSSAGSHLAEPQNWPDCHVLNSSPLLANTTSSL